MYLNPDLNLNLDQKLDMNLNLKLACHLLLSQPAYHASGRHGKAIFNAVEALTFLGVPFGFLPSDGLGGAAGGGLAATLAALPTTDTLLLPGLTHLGADAAVALSASCAAADRASNADKGTRRPSTRSTNSRKS